MSFIYDNNNLYGNDNLSDMTLTDNEITCRSCIYNSLGKYDLIEGRVNFNNNKIDSNKEVKFINEGFTNINEGFTDLNEGCASVPLSKLDKIFKEKSKEKDKEKDKEKEILNNEVMMETDEKCFSTEGIASLRKLDKIFKRDSSNPLENIATATTNMVQDLVNPRSPTPPSNAGQGLTVGPTVMQNENLARNQVSSSNKESILNLSLTKNDVADISANLSTTLNNTLGNTLTPNNINALKGAVDDVSKNVITNLSQTLANDISKNLSKDLNLSTSIKVKDLYVNVSGVLDKLEPLKKDSNDILMDMSYFMNIVKANSYVKKDSKFVFSEGRLVENFDTEYDNRYYEGFQNEIEPKHTSLFEDLFGTILIVLVLVILVFRK